MNRAGIELWWGGVTASFNLGLASVFRISLRFAFCSLSLTEEIRDYALFLVSFCGLWIVDWGLCYVVRLVLF